jgi:hypothetical protein
MRHAVCQEEPGQTDSGETNSEKNAQAKRRVLNWPAVGREAIRTFLRIRGVTANSGRDDGNSQCAFSVSH